MECYSPNDEKQTLVSPMKFNRANHGCCSHVGQLFVCGGKDNEASTCCEKLNLSKGVWKFVADMNVARKCFRVISCGKFMWAFGGEGIDGKALSSTEFYDEVADKWTLSTSMKENRQYYGAVGFRDNIFVVGGLNYDKEVLSSSEVFDTNTKQFTYIRPMIKPLYAFAAAISGYKLYCFSGLDDDDNELKIVTSFNLYTEDWKKEDGMIESYGYDALTVY